MPPTNPEFQDYWSGESGGALLPAPKPSVFAAAGAHAGQQPQLMPFLDDPWAHYDQNTDIRAPLFGTDELIAYVQDCVATRAVPTMNVGLSPKIVICQPPP